MRQRPPIRTVGHSSSSEGASTANGARAFVCSWSWQALLSCLETASELCSTAGGSRGACTATGRALGLRWS
eukprot:COSAG01_NODE_5847_length_3998_cov_19.111824_5_plen_71_part_00